MALELSLFFDESGSDAMDSKYYLLAIVLHDQSNSLADYICTMELTALKYADHETTATDEKFFGSWSMFKKGILKEVRTKAFGDYAAVR